MVELIRELRKQSSEQNVKIWKRVASDLEKPTRQRRIVNLYKLDNYTKNDETVIVPGKVLGTGDLNHKVNVAAFNFSRDAARKIIDSKGTILSIYDLMKKNPRGNRVRILG